MPEPRPQHQPARPLPRPQSIGQGDHPATTPSMSSLLRPDEALVREEPYPLERHPVTTAYLTRLAQSGRDTMRYQLKQAAFLLTAGRCDMMTLPWHCLTYVHLSSLRTKLIDQGKAPQSCNTLLYAVKGVLKQCRKLG